jgi:hypothetical protein
MDSNFQYASTVRWYRATDLPLPPTVKRRSAGRPPPMARRSEAQRGSVRRAATMRPAATAPSPTAKSRSLAPAGTASAAGPLSMRRAAMRAAAVKCRTAAVDGGYAMVAVWKSDLVGSDIDPLLAFSGSAPPTVAGGPGFCGT